ncbi:MAG: glycoside hydrolase family 5 protein [Fimbriimonadales bacterium]|nr:glycoside hydrolase family 5 protein [Fimbriimonadales bacterium]
MLCWTLLPHLLVAASGPGMEAAPSPVSLHGALRVERGRIVGKFGNPVSLAGPSLFWSQWMPQFYNRDCVRWIATDWKAGVVRAAVAVEPDGYLVDPERERAKAEAVIEAAVESGLYVIVDWHDHRAHLHTEQAVGFFQAIARKYGDKPNVIYEIYNEPMRVGWPEIKAYSERVIAAIRAIDPDNIIVVGTPNWSQDVDAAAGDPLKGTNLAYALHFYAGTHKAWLRDKADRALAAGLALMVTEWGATNANGDGPIDHSSTREWLDWMRKNRMIWCNWSIADKREGSAMLRPGANPRGGWTEADLTESGRFVRGLIREWGF